jgi:hypothetical protein
VVAVFVALATFFEVGVILGRCYTGPPMADLGISGGCLLWFFV